MEQDQRHGRIFGVLFIITFITSSRRWLSSISPRNSTWPATSPVAARTYQIDLGAFLDVSCSSLAAVGMPIVVKAAVTRLARSTSL